jgi:hypothetical protein
LIFVILLAGCGGSGDAGSEEGQADVPTSPAATDAELRLYQIAIYDAPFELYSRLDYLTNWIYQHSVHNSEASPFDSIVDVDSMARAILAYIDGVGPKPNLKCSHRANILKTILQLDGKRARLVNIMGNGTPDGYLYGHVFIEFWTSAEGGWIIADPDFLTYWVVDGRRISVADAIKLDYENMVPCNLEGQCSYLIENSEGSSPQVFIDYGLFSAAIELSDEWDNYSYTHFYINAKKVDPNEPIEGQSLLERYGWLPTTIFN